MWLFLFPVHYLFLTPISFQFSHLQLPVTCTSGLPRAKTLIRSTQLIREVVDSEFFPSHLICINRHHASRSLRYQAVHRDLPPEGCLLYVSPVSSAGTWNPWEESRSLKLTFRFFFSRPDQAQPQVPADQVQGPLPPHPLLPCPEGLRQGRQAQAEPAPWYVEPHTRLNFSPRPLEAIPRWFRGGDGADSCSWRTARAYADIYFFTIALKVVDVSNGGPKKSL